MPGLPATLWRNNKIILGKKLGYTFGVLWEEKGDGLEAARSVAEFLEGQLGDEHQADVEPRKLLQFQHRLVDGAVVEVAQPLRLVQH